jgi:hypothetical protein
MTTEPDAFARAQMLIEAIAAAERDLAILAVTWRARIERLVLDAGIHVPPADGQFSIFDSPPPPDPPMVRKSDPGTSHSAARSVSVRSGSQQARLLALYAAPEHAIKGLSSSEAGSLSGLSDNPACCYWKRVSELHAKGLIEPTGERRVNALSGEDQVVYRLTSRGQVEAERLTS